MGKNGRQRDRGAVTWSRPVRLPFHTRVTNKTQSPGKLTSAVVFTVCSGAARRDRADDDHWTIRGDVRRPVSRVLSPPRSIACAADCGDGRPFLWDARCRTPHATNPGGGARPPCVCPPLARRARPAAPIRSCSRWGLPCHRCCQRCGALLPPRFTRSRIAERVVCFLWHFP